MAKPTSSNAISEKLFSLHMTHGYSSEQYLAWAVDDYLADLTQQKKNNPPPQDVMPILFELGQLYAKEVINNAPFSDILGRTYMDLVSRGGQKMLAQYFTPEPVARLMAQLNSADGIDRVPQDDLYRVYEPTCGSGVMLLQVCNAMAEHHGEAILERVSITAVDLDRMCSKMTSVQLLANAMMHQFSYGEILVLHGNSLGDPTKLTPIVHATHARLKGVVLPAQHPARTEMIRKVVEATPEVKKRCEEQLALF